MEVVREIQKKGFKGSHVSQPLLSVRGSTYPALLSIATKYRESGRVGSVTVHYTSTRGPALCQPQRHYTPESLRAVKNFFCSMGSVSWMSVFSFPVL